ncbi:MAG: abortive infection family protein [Nitrosomonadales bacterium]|nr:abortive infection family protein [Nitrosomonadales bacterium]
MKISQITRRDLVDAILVEKVNWAGRLEEPEFLSRLFDLSALPSTDSRFPDAAGDIWQHRINNSEDWEDDWVFYDRRFNLLNCDDEVLLRFLCETIHPVVRPDVTEAERLCQLYNSFLKNDGFQLVERARLSGKPIFVGRYVGVIGAPGVSAARETLSGSDVTYVAQQITRMEAAVNSDPGLAIGTAKELIETCCKTILNERNVAFSSSMDIPQLVKLTSKELKLTPDDIEDQAKAAETIKRLLSNLATITQGIAELRNKYGTGHGKVAKTKGLSPRHAKLAVGAASTLAVFLVETHHARRNEP